MRSGINPLKSSSRAFLLPRRRTPLRPTLSNNNLHPPRSRKSKRLPSADTTKRTHPCPSTVRSSRSAATSYADHLVDIPVDPGLDALPRHHLPGNSPPSSDDGQADADGDYVPGPNDHLAQQVYAEAQPQGQEEVTASYYAPDGFRESRSQCGGGGEKLTGFCVCAGFCSGCVRLLPPPMFPFPDSSYLPPRSAPTRRSTTLTTAARCATVTRSPREATRPLPKR